MKTFALIGTALILSACATSRTRDVADYGGSMTTTRPAAEVVDCLVRTLGAGAPVQDAVGGTVITAQGADPARYTVSSIAERRDAPATTQVLIQSVTPNIDEERRAALCALPRG